MCDCDPAELKLDYEAFARQVLDVCVRLKPGEKVWISTWEHHTELSSQLALQCLKRGCPTLTTVQFDKPWLYTIQEAPAEFAERLSASEAALLNKIDVYIFTLGPRIIPWDKIPPERRKLVTTCRIGKKKFEGKWSSIVYSPNLRLPGSPAVSTSRNGNPSITAPASMASRVVPGTSVTIARSRPRSALKSDDFPALGRPAMTSSAPSRNRSPSAAVRSNTASRSRTARHAPATRSGLTGPSSSSGKSIS